MFYLDLLDLCPQLFQGAVPIDAVRDIISKAVAQHPFSVSFPNAITLTQPAEGMAAGVRCSLRKAQFPQRSLHIPPER